MGESFLNREVEIETLARAWNSRGAGLVVVWGRRRTGKTRLLGRFVEGKRAVFYGATEQAASAELRGLSAAVRRALPPSGDDLLAHGDFPTWEAALRYLRHKATRHKLAVVLDEFPYLVAAEPALPSIIQRFWDHEGRSSKLQLVLCGSAQALMQDLQTERAPLFGRIDTRLHLRPFVPDQVALFVPRLSAEQCAICHAVLGGMPTYLSRWDDRVGHRANLRRLFADPSSPLVAEGEFVLTSELRAASGYFRILRAIAAGHTTYGAIRQFADIEVQRQLERLIEVELIGREVPVTEDPTRTKQVVYRIADNFLAFWFRFVYRRRADIERGLGRDVVDHSILPALSDYVGPRWEQACREFVRRKAAHRELPVEVSSVGRWWNRDSSVEIDVVGLRDREVVLVGSAKWARTTDARELRRLRRAAASLPRVADDIVYALFAREGVRGVSSDEALSFTARDVFPAPAR
jgi:hypothetical protein